MQQKAKELAEFLVTEEKAKVGTSKFTQLLASFFVTIDLRLQKIKADEEAKLLVEAKQKSEEAQVCCYGCHSMPISCYNHQQ
jgi:hypothetical protein